MITDICLKKGYFLNFLHANSLLITLSLNSYYFRLGAPKTFNLHKQAIKKKKKLCISRLKCDHDSAIIVIGSRGSNL